MVIGSHNSWSFHRARRWWLRPLAWMAKCQRVPIATQYDVFGVRCFDLRLRFKRNGEPVVAHGLVEYDIRLSRLWDDLAWLDGKGDAMVRIIHEVRCKRQHTAESRKRFERLTASLVMRYKGIRWWCGRNLADWSRDYPFENDPTCAERYASVCQRWMGWWPWLWAYRNNRVARVEPCDADVLLLDYVDID